MTIAVKSNVKASLASLASVEVPETYRVALKASMTKGVRENRSGLLGAPKFEDIRLRN